MDTNIPKSPICSYGHGKIISDYCNIWEDGETAYDRFDKPECFYCHSLLEETLFSDKLNPKLVGFRYSEAAVVLKICPNCGWWRIRRSLVRDGETFGEILMVMGEVKHYDVASRDVPLVNLRDFLSKHPNHLAFVNPSVFERLMRDCLKSFYDNCEVTHVGCSGDGGVDIKLVTTDEEVFLVQVKRRQNLSKPEGVKVVRELNGVLFREGRAKGMVITTAKTFTRGAYAETTIRTATSETYVVKLLAFDDVVDMLRLPRFEPYEPWSKYFLEIGLGKTR